MKEAAIALAAATMLAANAYAAVEPQPVVTTAPDMPSEMTTVAASAAAGEPDIEAVWIGTTEWMSGVAFSGGETFGGSISKGINFFTSSILPNEYVPVELRLSTLPADETLCQTFRRPGYASVGVGSFPGSAWDMSNPGSPRRLNICFVEWDDGFTPPNWIWDPDGQGAPFYGRREYVFIMNSNYDGTGTTYAGDNIFSDPLDVLYAWWPLVAGGHTFFENEPATLEITPYYARNFYAVPQETELKLGWVPTAVGLAQTRILWGSSDPPTNVLDVVPGATTQYDHTGLTTGVTLYYQVELLDGASNIIGTSKVLAATPQTVSSNLDLVACWHGRARYGDCWGYYDPVTMKEYALICARNEGVSIVDIEVDPPVEIAFMASIGPGNDAKDVKIYNNYAIVIKEWEPIQIFDLSTIATPVQVTTIQPDGGWGAHNCMVDGDYLYVVGNRAVGGLEIFDLSALPAMPPRTDDHQPFYYHDVDVRNNVFYGCGIYGDGIDVLDVSNKSAITGISLFNYAGSGAHNAELLEGNYIAVGDEIGTNGQHTRIFDITDINNVSLVSQIIIDPLASVHNSYHIDTLLFIAHYTEGLRVWSVADPTNPYEVAYWDTYLPSGYGYAGAWNVYPLFASGKIIVSDMQTGLYVFRLPTSCACPSQGDVAPLAGPGDGAVDVLDVVAGIDEVFRSGPTTHHDATCPEPRLDIAPATAGVQCGDGAKDVLDVVALIDHVFRSGPAPCDPCAP